MTRFYPAFVSFLGSFGIATTLVYFVAVVLSFIPGFDWVSARMVGTPSEFSFGFLFVIVPYLLITAHLYLRTKLGLWLVERGAIDEAISFSGKRTTPSFLRSRAEALSNRVALSLAWASRGSIDRALEVLDGVRPTKSNAFFWMWAGWKAEMLLRDDDPALGSFLEETGKPRGKRSAHFAAIGALYFHETGNREESLVWLQSAQWAQPDDLNVQLVESIVLDRDDTDVWNRAVAVLPSREGERIARLGHTREHSVDDARSSRLCETVEEEE